MKRTLVIILIIALALAVSACDRGSKTAQKADDPTDKNLPAPQSHSISKKDEKQLMKDIRDNLDIIMAVRDTTAPLKKALSGHALNQMSEQVASEAAANRIKVRQYDDIKLELQNITKDVAGLALTFTDKTYVIEADTGDTIKEATGKKIEFLIAAKKVGKRWRMIEIFSKELTPQGKKRTSPET